jgi:hypothetical protein
MATTLQHPETRAATPGGPAKGGGAGPEILATGGVAGIVLGALGLMEISPVSMAAAAVVVQGAAIALAGGLFAKASKAIFGKSPSGRHATLGGFSAEIVVGLIAAGFGILALAGVSTMNLISIGVLILGMSLWVGFIAVEQFDQVLPTSALGGRKAAGASSGLNILCSVVAACFGILAWMGVAPRILTLIGAMVIGIAVLNMGYGISRRTFPRVSLRVRG